MDLSFLIYKMEMLILSCVSAIERLWRQGKDTFLQL